MKFHTGKDSKHRIKASLDMTPIIDVVFQLILFFMLSSTFVVQDSIKIQIPETDGTAKLETKDLTITLTVDEAGFDGDGGVYLDSVQVTGWEDLSTRLDDRLDKNMDLMLLIRADGRVPTSRLVRVWGLATSLGITRFGVAAQPLENAPAS